MNQTIQDKIRQLETTSWDFRNIAPEEGVILNTLIKAAGYKNILESGTSNGYSTIWLAEAVMQTNGRIKTIEINPEKIVLAKKNFNEAGVSDYISVIEGDSLGVMQGLDQKFDLIFIDGGKDYFELFKLIDSKLLKKGGILAVDNVISHGEEHKHFLDAINEDENYQKVVINYGGGLLVALKNG